MSARSTAAELNARHVRIGVLDARIAEQARRVAGIEEQDREIADAIAKLTAKGSAKSAIAATEAQQKRRDGIARARQEAADRLVELQGDRARLDAEGRRVAAQAGPVTFSGGATRYGRRERYSLARGAVGDADRSVGGRANDCRGAAELTRSESACGCEAPGSPMGSPDPDGTPRGPGQRYSNKREGVLWAASGTSSFVHGVPHVSNRTSSKRAVSRTV